MKITLAKKRLTAKEIAIICDGAIYPALSNGSELFETVCTDSREADKTSMFVAIEGEKVDGNAFIPNVVKNGCRVILTEKVPLDVKGISAVIVADVIKALGRIAEYVRDSIDTKIVAVTGSVGKTTTKGFVSSVLSEKYSVYKTKGNFNSTLGMPMSMLEMDDSYKTAVLEMGMSGRGEIEFMSKTAKPDIAVITNIGTSHLELLGTRENIRDAKMEIVAGLKDGGTLLLNGDEPLLEGHKSERYNVLYFGKENKNSDYFASHIKSQNGEITFDLKTPNGIFENIKINRPGEHNVYAAMISFAVGIMNGETEEEIRQGILNFKTEGMRQNVYTVGGVTIIEDCYNASPESMNAAISLLNTTKGKRKIALLGDMRELGDNSPLYHENVGKEFAKHGDFLFTYGSELSDEFAKGAIEGGMNSKRVIRSGEGEFESAGEKLLKTLKAGDVLLVKASRAMKAENVLNYVKERLATN